ncbi:MAG: hypothetical protein J6X92_06235 [Bacteroidales bacterium]|nr:hypothetical protein [Bacteroidales bacterium]
MKKLIIILVTLSLSVVYTVNAQNDVSSCKTYMVPRNIIFSPPFFLYRRGLFIMSFDYDNNKCLEINYPAIFSFVDIFEHSFKQIGDTLEVDLSDISGIEETNRFLLKGNRLYRLNIYGEISKRSRGYKLINDKKISRIQQKNKDSFKNNHIIIEDSCFRLEKQQK